MAARGDYGARDGALPQADAARATLMLRVFAVALFLACAATSALMAGPITHQDEGSYLLNAAAIAGKLKSGLVSGYYSGYSVLFVPAFLAFSSFSAIYHYALLVNALLLASLPFALYRIVRIAMPAATPAWLALAAMAASCQIALLTDSQQTLSENVLAPLYAWLLAFGGAAIEARRSLPALIAGALAGALYLVHPRGALLALPVLAALSLPAWRERALWAPALAMWLGAIAVALLHAPLEYLALKATQPEVEAYSLTSLISRLLSKRAWAQIAFNCFGVFSYLVLATFGVAMLGGWQALAPMFQLRRHARSGFDACAALRIAMLLGLASSVFVTAVYFNSPERVDQVLYGRYALPALIPLLALGLVALRDACKVNRLFAPAWWAVAAGFACVIAMILAFRYVPHPPSDIWVHTNIVDLYVPFALTGRADWPTIGFYFCVGAFALYSACRLLPGSAPVLYAALNVAVTAYVIVSLNLPSNAMRVSERQIEPSVRAFERATGVPVCIDLAPDIDNWHAVDYRNWLYDRIGESAVVDRSRCVRGIIATLKGSRPPSEEYRLVTVDMHNPYALFIRESPALERYAATHALPPPDFPAPLPEIDRTAAIEVDGLSDSVRIRAGSAYAFEARVTHVGGNVIWPALFDPSPLLALRVGARLDPLDGGDPHVEFRADLPRPLGPDQSASTTVTIGPFSKPGRYRIEVGALQEGIAWLDKTRSFTIEVFGSAMAN